MTDPIECCNQERESLEALLRAGHPDVAGLCLALYDWCAEARLLIAVADQDASCAEPDPSTHPEQSTVATANQVGVDAPPQGEVH